MIRICTPITKLCKAAYRERRTLGTTVLYLYRAYSSLTQFHYRVVITSDAFKSKMQPARHRMVYALLKEEMDRAGGIHALQLRTKTPEEEERQLALEKEEQGHTIGEIENQ